MPYINQTRRVLLDQEITALKDALGDPSVNPGDFNYAITRLLLPSFEISRLETKAALPVPRGSSAVSYRYINAVMGILQCVGAEFYRRVAAPYEDKKLQENGDVLQSMDGWA